MKQQFVKNRRSGEFGYRLDTETGDAGGDGFDSVVGVKKTCKVELFNFSINIFTNSIWLSHLNLNLPRWDLLARIDRKPPFNEDL